MELTTLKEMADTVREAYDAGNRAGFMAAMTYGQDLYDAALDAARDGRKSDLAFKLMNNYMSLLREKNGAVKLDRDGEVKLNHNGDQIRWPTCAEYRARPCLDWVIINSIDRMVKAAEGEGLGL